MIVVLNGKEIETAKGVSVNDLLSDKGIKPKTVVVELNGDIIPGQDFATTKLEDGDKLEVLRFVGGG